MKTQQRHPRTWREERRLRAWELKRAGWCQRDIAEALGISPGAVSKWIAAADQGGRRALQARPIPGRPPRITDAQKRLLPDLLWRGPEAYGFRGAVWTCARVARVIEQEFGARYHQDHVGRLLKELGWTPQVPQTPALQRDEEAVDRWRQQVWPRLKKRRRGRAGS